MYAARIQVVQDHFGYENWQKVAVTSVIHTSRIVPDMPIEYLKRDELVAKCDPNQPGVRGAMALFDRAEDGEVPFVLRFPDGDMLTTLVTAQLLRHE